MQRLVFFASALLTSAWCAQEAAPRVLDAKRYHLGTAGLPEWHEFESSTPHGRQLEITFRSSASSRESTLLIRQRNVKTNWNVSLNGQKTLETLTQPLMRALSVPAGRSTSHRCATIREF